VSTEPGQLHQEVVGIADYAPFLGFGTLVGGREMQAMKAFGSGLQH
jgi:hypothetical protein